MAEQLVFDLPAKTAFGRDDFFTSPANALAVDAIESWPDWPQNKLVLTGPNGSGKSHLAAIWAGLCGATVLQAGDLCNAQPTTLVDNPLCVEDIHKISGDTVAEAALFHIFNLAQENGTPLLMTGCGSVGQWGITLPDLASRLQGSNTVALPPPDDILLSAVLLKHFADHQLRVEPGLVAYILVRIERSFAAAQKLVTSLDRQALRDKRPISMKMARQILEAMEQEAL